MARSTSPSGGDDFERAWEAITGELGDLGAGIPLDGGSGDRSGGARRPRRRGHDDAAALSPDSSPDSSPPGAPSPAGGEPAGAASPGWGGDAPFAMGGPRDYEPAPDEGFTPPEPVPISGHRPWLILGWCGLTASALTLLVCGIVRAHIPAALPQVAGGALLISLIVLFTQLPKGKRDPDDPDKGAVV